MRIFAISDLHVDYEENLSWVEKLSTTDFQQDILILAGDISNRFALIERVLTHLNAVFQTVCFVPGNHDLWISFDKTTPDSISRYHEIRQLAQRLGIQTDPLHLPNQLSIIPLLSWYDFSFAPPTDRILRAWQDFNHCVWPEDFDEALVTQFFLQENEAFLHQQAHPIISFSHFLPRIDIMPSFIPEDKYFLHAVLGTKFLELQVQQLQPIMHVYGHSHVNNEVKKGNTTYINNAFGYPREVGITAKTLKCIYEI